MTESENAKSPLLWLLLLFFVGFALALVFLLGCGGAIGWLLHRFWPAIDVGMSMLIGVVATSAAGVLFVKTLGSMVREVTGYPPPIGDDWDEDDDDDDDDDSPVYITNLPPSVARRHIPDIPRKRNKRRRR